MVNNYPEYAAGVNFKKTDSNDITHFYSAQVVADPATETVESKLIKDGVVIDEGGGGGSSDLNNPIELELIESESGTLVTKLTTSEIYELCQTGTPYFKLTAEQVETYQANYLPNAKYFINEYFTVEDGGVTLYDFQAVLLGIVDTTEDVIITKYASIDLPAEDVWTIASQL